MFLCCKRGNLAFCCKSKPVEVMSTPSVFITLFSANIPIQSIQVAIYPVLFFFTKTAIGLHAVNFVENTGQLIVEFACFTPVEASPLDSPVNLLP
jgi:hypothetical protein